MDDRKRLELIAEAVQYCKRVAKMDMPPNSYTKALREPVHFLWERRIGAVPPGISGPKVCAAKFRSVNARGLTFGNRKLVYDHAIPWAYLQEEFLALQDFSPNWIREVLEKFCVPALITTKEHQLLGRSHYRDRMPDGWNGVDPLARYEAVEIPIVENEPYFELTRNASRSNYRDSKMG